MGYVSKVVALVALVLLPACNNQVRVTQSTPQGVPVTTIPEGVSPRTATGQGGITWLEPTGAAKDWQEVSSARSEVEREISAEAQPLNSVDYASLALPDFITVTRSMQITPDNFTGQPLSIEAFGTGKNNERWTLYTWQGPEIPQRADRPLVHRWIQVYALYDMDAKRVTTLLTTIHGEAHE